MKKQQNKFKITNQEDRAVLSFVEQFVSWRGWWRWPAKSTNSYLPWYSIGWRLLLSPFIYTGMAITWIALLLCRGYYFAKDWWRAAS